MILEAEVNISQVFDQNGLDINNASKGETIRKMAQHIIQDKLSERNAKAISRILEKTSPDTVVALSCLSKLRRELQTLNVLEKIISATKNLKTTKLSNKIQKECNEQRKNERLHYPDHFSLKSVKEKLDEYDVSNIPDKQALADIMIILCICPAKIKNLRISNGDITGYAKN